MQVASPEIFVLFGNHDSLSHTFASSLNTVSDIQDYNTTGMYLAPNKTLFKDCMQYKTLRGIILNGFCLNALHYVHNLSTLYISLSIFEVPFSYDLITKELLFFYSLINVLSNFTFFFTF